MSTGDHSKAKHPRSFIKLLGIYQTFLVEVLITGSKDDIGILVSAQKYSDQNSAIGKLDFHVFIQKASKQSSSLRKFFGWLLWLSGFSHVYSSFSSLPFSCPSVLTR